MSNVLGSLLVKLGVDFGEWTVGLDKQAYNVAQFAKKTEREFKSIANSISFVTTTFGAFGAQGAVVSQIFLAMGRAAATTTKSIASLSGPLGALAGPIAGIGVGALSAAAGLAALSIKTAETAARTYELSRATGLHASSLAALSPLAKAFGIDQEYLARALERMNKNLLAAEKASHLASNGFTDLKINAHEFAKLSMEDKVLKLAKEFQRISGSGREAAVAIEIFGRAGANMLPFLIQGPEVLKKWMDFARQVGAALGDDFYAGAHKLKEEGIKMEVVWQGFANTMTSVLLPVMVRLATAFTSAMREGQGFSGLAKTLGSALVGTAKVIGYMTFALNDLWINLQRVKVGLEGLAMKGGKGVWSTEAINAQKNAMNDLNIAKEKNFVANDAFQAGLNQPLDLGGVGGQGGGTVTPPNKELISALERLKKTFADLHAAAEKARAQGAALGEAFGPKIWKEASASAAEFTARLHDQFAQFEGKDKKVIDAFIAQNSARALSDKLTESIAAFSKQQVDYAQKEVMAIKEQVAALHEKNEADRIGGALAKAAVGAPGRIAAVAERTDAARSVYETAITRGDTAAIKLTGAIFLATMAKEIDAIIENGKLSAEQVEAFVIGEIKKVSAIQRTEEEIENIQNVLGKGIVPGLSKEAQAKLDEQRSKLTDSQRIDLEQSKGLAEIKLAGQRMEQSAIMRTAALRRATFDEEMKHARDMFAAQNAAASERVARATQAIALQKQQFEYDNADLLLAAKAKDAQRALVVEWDNAAISVGSLKDKTSALFNELVLEGDNFTGKITDAFKKGIDGWETSLAHFVVTGKGSLREVVTSFEESVLKAGIQKGVGVLANQLSQHTGLTGISDLLKKGAGIKRDGSSPGNSLYVTPVGVGGGIVGSLPIGRPGYPSITGLGGGFGLPNIGPGGTAPFLPEGPGGGILSTIFGGGSSFFGLGSGKPDGSSGNPLYVKTSASGLIGGLELPMGVGKRGAGTDLGGIISGVTSKVAAKAGSAAMGADASAKAASYNKIAQAAAKAAMAEIWASLAWIPIVGPPLAAAFGAIMLGQMAAATAIGALAKGGDVTPGAAYMVGERGPELFVSGASGHVFPNDTVAAMRASGNTSSTTQNDYVFAPVISVMDASSVDAVLSEHGQKFVDHMERHARRNNFAREAG